MMTRDTSTPSAAISRAAVVRHRPRRREFLDLQRDRVGLRGPDPDRQHALTSSSRRITIGTFVTGSSISP
jgi:hypothetical protein